MSGAAPGPSSQPVSSVSEQSIPDETMTPVDAATSTSRGQGGKDDSNNASSSTNIDGTGPVMSRDMGGAANANSLTADSIDSNNTIGSPPLAGTPATEATSTSTAVDANISSGDVNMKAEEKSQDIPMTPANESQPLQSNIHDSTSISQQQPSPPQLPTSQSNGPPAPAQTSTIATPTTNTNTNKTDTAMETVQSVTQRLLSLRGSPPGTVASLSESEIKTLCQLVRPILLSQPMLIELEAPLKICGDVHGQYTDLLRLFEYGGFPPRSNYLFLGDYVDRGKQSLETICLLLCYKIQYPQNFFILRGNHEAAGINRIYGFYDECKRRYSIRLWKTFSDVFNCLPVSALVDEKILCMHGGLSPEMENLQQIADLSRPCDVPDMGLMCDLLWSDPETGVTGWAENDRGVSFVFGADVVSDFLERHDLDLLVRAHQVVEDGYEFFAGRRLVTLFSAPNYCGEFDNAGGMISVDENLMCSFQILKPSSRSSRFGNNNNNNNGNTNGNNQNTNGGSNGNSTVGRPATSGEISTAASSSSSTTMSDSSSNGLNGETPRK